MSTPIINVFWYKLFQYSSIIKTYIKKKIFKLRFSQSETRSTFPKILKSLGNNSKLHDFFEYQVVKYES